MLGINNSKLFLSIFTPFINERILRRFKTPKKARGTKLPENNNLLNLVPFCAFKGYSETD